jgi:hypothetical protein
MVPERNPVFVLSDLGFDFSQHHRIVHYEQCYKPQYQMAALVAIVCEPAVNAR